jgi:hypothetical protein
VSEPPAVDSAPRQAAGRGAVPLARPGDIDPPTRFHRGAHSPFAIRWFGSTALLGHLRRAAAAVIASQAVDTRDWMRPDRPDELLAHASRVLRAPASEAPTLVERLGRPVWIDFVADTGDDRDVSAAVAHLVFAEYAPAAATEPEVLPRGDILLFGGDTAYPVSTGREILRRVVQPWNEVLRETGTGGRRRVLLGIPGNHDWFDGLDGFARLFRRDAVAGLLAHWEAERAHHAHPRSARDRRRSTLVRQLHLDEVLGSVDLVRSAAQSLRAIVQGTTVHRVARLALRGYTAVQEASYWVLPLAPGLELWGVDRQLRRLDFRQRTFFLERRAERPEDRLVFLAPDPALAFGERNAPGQAMLSACRLSLESDRVLYLCGDLHHYERRVVGESLHVIAGGGGAFLHGTRIPPAPDGPAACAYPDAATSRRLARQLPWKLMAGAAGFLPHMTFGVLAALQLLALHHGAVAGAVTTALVALACVGGFTLAVRGRRGRWARTLGVTVPFGLAVALAPLLLREALARLAPAASHDGLVALGQAVLGALLFGGLLSALALTGLEHEEGFAALGHPGFRHFVRIRVDPDGGLEAWVIGKDDPLGPGRPVLVDHFAWRPPR